MLWCLSNNQRYPRFKFQISLLAICGLSLAFSSNNQTTGRYRTRSSALDVLVALSTLHRVVPVAEVIVFISDLCVTLKAISFYTACIMGFEGTPLKKRRRDTPISNFFRKKKQKTHAVFLLFTTKTKTFILSHQVLVPLCP